VGEGGWRGGYQVDFTEALGTIVFRLSSIFTDMIAYK
jgi:hypothetical protein